MARRRGLLLTLTTLLTLPVVPLASQEEEEGLTIEFDIGGPPRAIPVSTIVNGSKQPSARSEVGGTAVVPFNLVNGPKRGDRVRVVVHYCGDDVEVVLIPEGELYDCDDEPPPGMEDCDCEDLGVIVWGETRRIRIWEDEEGFGMDVADEVLTAEGPVTRWRRGFYLSVVGGFDYRPLLEDVAVGLQPLVEDSSEVDDVKPFFGASVEYRPLKWLGVGIGGSWANHDVLQSYVEADTLPLTGDFNFTTWTVGPQVTLSTYVSPRSELYASLKKKWFRNEGDVTWTFPGGQTIEEDRSVDGWRDGFGAGFRYWATPQFALMVGAEYLTSFEGDDADDSLRGYLGFGYSSTLTCGGTCFTPYAGGNR